MILDTLKRCTYHYSGAEVAQSVEHSTENAGVVSSILTLGTLQAAHRHTITRSPSAGRTKRAGGRSSVVERVLAKDEVVGSNPIARSSPYWDASLSDHPRLWWLSH